MKEYLKTQSKTNELIVSGVLSDDEIIRSSKADDRWASSKGRHLSARKIKKGEIYQIEFGKNFAPEMSYEHRGLVIGIHQKMIHVLPIFTYDREKHRDVYHITDFPHSKSNLFLLKNEEFSFIKRDSVLKLNDIRTVSINRVLYKHEGRLEPESIVYKDIERFVRIIYFPEFQFSYNTLLNELKTIREYSEKLEKEIEALRTQK